ncbi:MAG: DUF6286 domain-containing protein [Schaalia odontolytica]|nr:DUF6286 domain-containing protein [Schaalia odontolytica]MDU5761131.1 DUF6286 domain-containing protein [Schaalia odontolytica]
MRTPVPSLIRLPSRTIPSIILALLLLTAGGLGAWITGHRIITGSWPTPAATALSAIGSATVGSPAALAVAFFVALGGLSMILSALWPGLPGRLEILPDDLPGQTAAKRRDLADLIRSQVEQVDGVHSVAVTIRRSRVDVLVLSVLDNLAPVQDAARQQTNEALALLAPVGISRSRVRVQQTR